MHSAGQSGTNMNQPIKEQPDQFDNYDQSHSHDFMTAEELEQLERDTGQLEPVEQ